MTGLGKLSQDNSEGTVSASRLLVLAACFGLITGLLEGVGLLAVHGFGWLNSRIPEGVSVEIVWISAIVNLLIFSALGVGLVTLGRIFPRLPVLRYAYFLFPFLAFADWVGLSGRISVLGVGAFAAGLAVIVSGRIYQHRSKMLHLVPRLFAWSAAVTLVAFFAIEAGIAGRERIAARHLPAAEKQAPNILVVVVDTLRADHLSAYGYGRATSPQLERVAKQGALFENAISTSSWTLPAHQSLLTGRYPHEHGPLREQTLNESYPTLAQVLDSRGYRTAAFSANTDFFCRRAGFARGFLHFDDYFYSLGDMAYRTFWGRLFFRTYVSDLLGLDELPARRKASDVNRSLLHWIDGDQQKPFFAFINYFDLHYPYVPASSYRSKFAAGHGQPAHCSSGLLAQLDPLHRPTDFERLIGLTPDCFQLQVDAYDGAISYVDDQLDVLFSELVRRGLDKNTLVVITSDHGESFREHGLVTHGTSLYRELIGVPLIYWWPGHIPAGIRISRPISAASLPATILDLVGGADSKTFPVPSLVQLWKQPGSRPDWPYPISELAQDVYIPKESPAYRGWLKSILDPRWHLIVSQSDPAELYDWRQDSPEGQNLAESNQGKEVVSNINIQLWNQITPENHNKARLSNFPSKNSIARITGDVVSGSVHK